jgi:molybdate transport system substrate-binding protein
MMKKSLIRVLFGGLIWAAALAGAAWAERAVTVFAAASLRGALDEVAAAYGAPVVISYGGSAGIARQVAQGAPADLVILANVAWMDWLAGKGAVVGDSRRDLLGNALVVVAPVGAAALGGAGDVLGRLGDDGRLAMGQAESVPAGIYARQWLENVGNWEALRGRLAETEDVRGALALVARGEVPLAVVYASDALAEPRVGVVYQVAQDMHDKIVYPMALVSGHGAQAADFAGFLSSDVAGEIFARHGFVPLGAP